MMDMTGSAVVDSWFSSASCAAARAGLDASQLSGHSLRAGHVTQAAREGVEERDIARTTRHRSVEVLRRYVREASVFRANSSARLGL